MWLTAESEIIGNCTKPNTEIYRVATGPHLVKKIWVQLWRPILAFSLKLRIHDLSFPMIETKQKSQKTLLNLAEVFLPPPPFPHTKINAWNFGLQKLPHGIPHHLQFRPKDNPYNTNFALHPPRMEKKLLGLVCYTRVSLDELCL